MTVKVKVLKAIPGYSSGQALVFPEMVDIGHRAQQLWGSIPVEAIDSQRGLLRAKFYVMNDGLFKNGGVES